MSSEPLPFRPNAGTPTIGKCTICGADVTAHAKKDKPSEYYLKNPDGSYHRAFGKDYGTNICVKTKAEYEWQRTYKDNLAGMPQGWQPQPTQPTPQPQATPQPQSAPQPQPTIPAYKPTMLAEFNGALTALDVEAMENCARFHAIMWPKAMNIAYNLQPKDRAEQRIIACGFMHDFAQLWFATILAVEKRGVFKKTDGTPIPTAADD